MTMETRENKIQRLIKEEINIVDCDSQWPFLFQQEKNHLLSCLPRELLGRIEHIGSTAVPGLAAKPIVDLLVEVFSLGETKKRIVPILESQGYDYLWRPTHGIDVPPFYAWFIKRDECGRRTHHIHMVEPHFEHWDRLFFRDYLIEHPVTAEQYRQLKCSLAQSHPNDRVAYTDGKTAFIVKVTEEAKRFYGKTPTLRPADSTPE